MPMFVPCLGRPWAFRADLWEGARARSLPGARGLLRKDPFASPDEGAKSGGD